MSLKKFLKKVVEAPVRVAEKVVQAHVNVFDKIEKQARPIIKTAAVAGAYYYGGPQAGQIAMQTAWRPKDAGPMYAPATIPQENDLPWGMGGAIYGAPYREYPVFGEASGAPLGSGSTGAPSPQPFFTSPLFVLGIGGALVLLVLMMRR